MLRSSVSVPFVSAAGAAPQSPARRRWRRRLYAALFTRRCDRHFFFLFGLALRLDLAPLTGLGPGFVSLVNCLFSGSDRQAGRRADAIDPHAGRDAEIGCR